MHRAAGVGPRLATVQAVRRLRRQHRVVLLRVVDAAGFGHVGAAARVAVHRPRSRVVVRRAALAGQLHMGQHAQVGGRFAVRQPLAGGQVVVEAGGDEFGVGQQVLQAPGDQRQLKAQRLL